MGRAYQNYHNNCDRCGAVLNASERLDKAEHIVKLITDVRDLLATQTTNSHAVKLLDKALKGENHE